MVFAIEISCPSCGASANTSCVNRSTNGAKRPLSMHPVRQQAALALSKNRD